MYLWPIPEIVIILYLSIQIQSYICLYMDVFICFQKSNKKCKLFKMLTKLKLKRIMLKIYQGEQDGGRVGRYGVHLSPQIHQGYTFRPKSACREQTGVPGQQKRIHRTTQNLVGSHPGGLSMCLNGQNYRERLAQEAFWSPAKRGLKKKYSLIGP